MTLVTALLSLLFSFVHPGPTTVGGVATSASPTRMTASPVRGTGSCSSVHCNHTGGGILGGLIL